MTLDEAIRHCEEVAEAQEEVIKRRKIYVEVKGLTPLDECRKIAAGHRQLAEWLTELKEAKRLLKAAVEDLAKIPCNNDVYIPSSCNACIKQGNCDYSDSFKWRYADEALKLIGGSENG